MLPKKLANALLCQEFERGDKKTPRTDLLASIDHLLAAGGCHKAGCGIDVKHCGSTVFYTADYTCEL